ncbi:MAG TPA: heme NO-binding domain-containing protein [Candidatus Limnocylindrales bacterium]|nr:heme NO-binding domain-containing protein [Candidatus Limnocylindrales bacterium]
MAELKKFVGEKYGAETWNQLVTKAGVERQMYLQSVIYPDHDAFALVQAASDMTGLGVHAVMEGFGEFCVPHLIKQYEFLVKPNWDLFDFLENTEGTIHKIIRFKEGATPPRIATHRLSGDELQISYSSRRKMCALLKGMVKGSARHYKEEVIVQESSCMLRGDTECTVTVRRMRPRKPGV